MPSQLTMTSDRPITAPIDRSKVLATSGTRKASASTAVMTPSLNTSRVVVVGEELVVGEREHDHERAATGTARCTGRVEQPEQARARRPARSAGAAATETSASVVAIVTVGPSRGARQLRVVRARRRSGRRRGAASGRPGPAAARAPGAHSRTSSSVSVDATSTPMPVGGGLVDDPVDLVAGADVDALGGFVEQQHPRLEPEAPAEQDLLLVAAGQRGDRRLGPGRGDAGGARSSRRPRQPRRRRRIRPNGTKSRSPAIVRFSRTFMAAKTPGGRRSRGTKAMPARSARSGAPDGTAAVAHRHGTRSARLLAGEQRDDRLAAGALETRPRPTTSPRPTSS